MPSPCALCQVNRAVILRPKNHQRLCRTCFLSVFEAEIHHTITSNKLFHRGERVAIGASGGKDSTVLASVLKTLNERYDYGVELVLLSIDEGIKGYRDDSLETVKRNATQYDMPLKIVGYDELYGWTMDQVVEQVGKKGNCTYCGVFRRQALDRGAAMLGVGHVVTGHNADDMAETVLMNLLRGDLPRLSRTTSIVTSMPSAARSTISSPGTPSHTDVKRSKPLKYAYEKEIVLYAHHKSLDYFSTECIYSPEAFRGSARALIKNLERIRPSAILDIVRSGEDMAKLCPGYKETAVGASVPAAVPLAEVEEGGCGSSNGRTSGGEMQSVEEMLAGNEKAAAQELELEIGTDVPAKLPNIDGTRLKDVVAEKQEKKPKAQRETNPGAPKSYSKQTMGKCSRCGYLSSQRICKACMLLEGLNKSRPKTTIAVGDSHDTNGSTQSTVDLVKQTQTLNLALG